MEHVHIKSPHSCAPALKVNEEVRAQTNPYTHEAQVVATSHILWKSPHSPLRKAMRHILLTLDRTHQPTYLFKRKKCLEGFSYNL